MLKTTIATSKSDRVLEFPGSPPTNVGLVCNMGEHRGYEVLLRFPTCIFNLSNNMQVFQKLHKLCTAQVFARPCCEVLNSLQWEDAGLSKLVSMHLKDPLVQK